MQDFAQARGVRLPSVSESWERIRAWCDDEYPELGDTLNYPPLEEEVIAFEEAIGQQLPSDLRESYFLVNGQETDSTSLPTGLFFGVALMPLEEALTEWEIWRNVSQEYGQAFENQTSRPLGAIKEGYANSAWIPLCKDFVGNNIALDMDPGPKGTRGQIISFGRDQDTKYVIAPNWRSFLARFVFDLEAGLWTIDDEGKLYAKAGISYGDYFDMARVRYQQENPTNETDAEDQDNTPLASASAIKTSPSPTPTPTPTQESQQLLSPFSSPNLSRSHAKRASAAPTPTLEEAIAIVKQSRGSPNSSRSSVVMVEEPPSWDQLDEQVSHEEAAHLSTLDRNRTIRASDRKPTAKGKERESDAPAEIQVEVEV